MNANRNGTTKTLRKNGVCSSENKADDVLYYPNAVPSDLATRQKCPLKFEKNGVCIGDECAFWRVAGQIGSTLFGYCGQSGAASEKARDDLLKNRVKKVAALGNDVVAMNGLLEDTTAEALPVLASAAEAYGWRLVTTSIAGEGRVAAYCL